jgi:hypothetical protein
LRPGGTRTGDHSVKGGNLFASARAAESLSGDDLIRQELTGQVEGGRSQAPDEESLRQEPRGHGTTKGKVSQDPDAAIASIGGLPAPQDNLSSTARAAAGLRSTAHR